METPTAVQMREWSLLNYDRLGYTDDPKLQRKVDQACAYVASVTGQDFAALVPRPPLQEAQLASLMEQCIQLRTEQIVLQSQPDHAESAASNEVVQSFGAGLYNESRRDPNVERKRLNTWPQLDELLTGAMTPERFAEWEALVDNEVLPWWDVQEVNWHTDALVAETGLKWDEPRDTLVPSGTPVP
jgi:hypothetical protein